MPIETTPYDLAMRFVGIIRERDADRDDPQILAWLERCDPAADHDEVPWCSAMVNEMCRLLGLSRTGSLRARSWLAAGRVVTLKDARPGSDVVVLSRGPAPQPGPSVIHAPGHVGFFAGADPVLGLVSVLGGNQTDAVTVARYPADAILGIRRLAE